MQVSSRGKSDIVRDVIYYDKIKEIEPVYRSIATLNSKTIWDLIRKILTLLPTDVPEKIPQQILEKYDFVSWRDSINKIHMPESPDDISLYGRYVTRLAFEEMSEYQSKLSKARVRTRQVTKDSLSFTGELFKKLKALLPFQLTPDQLNVIDEITADQKSGQRMVRLIQGDVGSGKTLVAFAAMLHVKESGKQSALMAPTDILVKQHYNSLQKFSDDLSIKLAVLTGTMKKNEKVEVIQKIKDGEIDIIIGTHALFQSYVEFKDLGLIVVDEQHRFGVMQRYRMLQKNKTSDFLMMSATPIPRTLSMIAYGDMNISTIKNKPSNRIAIKTSILSLENIDKLIDALVKQDTKIYWLCPLINESEKISISNVMDRCKILEEKMP